MRVLIFPSVKWFTAKLQGQQHSNRSESGSHHLAIITNCSGKWTRR